MVAAEIAEGIRIQMPAMSRVAEGRKIGVVWSRHEDGTAWFEKTVELLHRAHHVTHMFYDVGTVDVVERIIGERVGERIDVANYIGATGWIAINPNGACQFVHATSHI